MRTFYEEWRMLDNPEYLERDMENETSNLEVAISKLDNRISLPVWNLEMSNYQKFPMDAFLHIGFTHHNVILGKIKDIEERIFYIRRCAENHCSVEELKRSISADDFHHQGKLPNNFIRTLSSY